MSERPRIVIGDVDFEWDREQGMMLVMGSPVVCMWIETTMAGLMAGLQKMVGTERFAIAAEQSGRESVEGEWQHVILKHPTIEDGIRWVGDASGTCGLGEFELLSMDRDKKEARFRIRSGWEGLYQRALGVSWGSKVMAGRFAGYCSHAFGTYCRAEQTAAISRGDAFDEFVVCPSERTLDQDLEALLSTEKATKADLTAAFNRLRTEVEERSRVEDELRREIEERSRMESELRREVEERKRFEEELRREVEERARIEEELRNKLDLIRRQEDAMRAMATPILQLWEGVLTMPVVGVVDSSRAAQMMENLLEQIAHTHARFTILDLTGVEVLDTSAAGHLLKLVQAARLLGTRCLISGISPGMASTIVALQIELRELETFGTLESALRHAIQQGRQTARAR